MFSSDRYLFSFVLLLLLVRLCDGYDEVHVKITNGLDNGLVLDFHCKSKDDDLGAHVLGSQQSSEFHFRPNVFGTTLFFCQFAWGSESHWFDIYTAREDECRKCWWLVRQDGPCLLNDKTGAYDICHQWNKGRQFQGSSLIGAGNDTFRIYNDSKYLEGNEKRGK